MKMTKLASRLTPNSLPSSLRPTRLPLLGLGPVLVETPQGGASHTARPLALAASGAIIGLTDLVVPIAATRTTAVAINPGTARPIEAPEKKAPGLHPAAIQANPNARKTVAEAPEAIEVAKEI